MILIFFKFIIPFRGGYCDYSHRALKHSYAADGMSGLCVILKLFMDGEDICLFEVTDFIRIKLWSI
jgi:hypothetical protein